jgi:uncharacterized membrane protein
VEVLEMMGWDSGLLLVAILACTLAFPLLLLAAGWLGLRALRASRWGDQTRSASALLERRLAAGEIDIEEYYERESALRSSEASVARR